MSSKRKPASSPVETEAKIRVASLTFVRRGIRALAGRRLSARTFEANTLFDGPRGELRMSGRSFRVRRYGASGSVCLKGPARVAGGVKSREELETEVASPEVLARILSSLGFLPRFRYEKFREVWKVGSTVVCLDETPLGAFIEIEGTPKGIARIAKGLDIDPSEFLSDSYPALWFQANRSGDMVFRGAKGQK
jgi:adenylate cyclase class 2